MFEVNDAFCLSIGALWDIGGLYSILQFFWIKLSLGKKTTESFFLQILFGRISILYKTYPSVGHIS